MSSLFAHLFVTSIGQSKKNDDGLTHRHFYLTFTERKKQSPRDPSDLVERATVFAVVV
jgi:hypothetical protein